MFSQPLLPRCRNMSPRPSSGRETPVVGQDDAQLIAAIRRGDTTAFEQLVRKYQNRLYSSLCYVCGSSFDAQDAVQEAFLRVYLRLDTYNGTSAFYTWLYRIAMNIVIGEHRKRKTRAAADSWTATYYNDSNDRSETPTNALLRKERVALIQQALSRLSSAHRAILILREMEDLDYDQIARILDIPVGTVRSRLSRARLELREQLSDWANNDQFVDQQPPWKGGLSRRGNSDLANP